MQQLTDSYTQSQNLHHAYIIEGNCDSCVSELTDFFANTVQLKTRGNPNFIIEQRDTFLIEDARRLRELQLNKTQKDDRKVFIMSFNFITRGAQNALLKVLEEPTAGTHIFLVTPRKQIFLPTVLSRVVLVGEQEVNGGNQTLISKDTEKFLAATYKDRMKQIVALVKKIKDEKKSKADAIMMLEEIIISLESDLHNKGYVTTIATAKKIQLLQRDLQYMQDQGASVKMLLEHTALIL